MARSSILGTSPPPIEPEGRDTASLGPGDSSDSGSDMMGLADSEGGDPNLATDLVAGEDQGSLQLSPDALSSSSDAAGTGESRGAVADGGKPDGWDIGVDKVFTPGGEEGIADEEDPDLAFIDTAEADDPQFEDDPDEAEDGDPAPGQLP